MPYKDRQKLREYQLAQLKGRREAWIAANGPCAKCGSSDDLEVDHRDSAAKVSHRIWSWSEARRKAELEKCQVLCRRCHQQKSADSLDGSYAHNAETVRRVRELHAQGRSIRAIASETGVARSQVHRIVTEVVRLDVPFV